MIYLYIKTHNKTGLKYFGKTIREPFSYLGSGTYWKKHLHKHGNDIKTEIVAVFEDKQKASDFALTFSETYDIVNSNEWANLIPENGINGGDTSKHIDYSYMSGNSHMNGNRGNKKARGSLKNKASSGRIWITDGITSRSIKKSDIIPEGWYKGRKIK